MIAAYILGEPSLSDGDVEALTLSADQGGLNVERLQRALGDVNLEPDALGLTGIVKEADSRRYMKEHPEAVEGMLKSDGEERSAGDGGTSAPIFRVVADWLMDDCGARYVCGVPVVRTGICYAAGQVELERRISRKFPNLRRQQRREALADVALDAPRTEDTSPRFLGFTNGVLDLRTMQLHPEGVSAVVTNQIPHRWNPDAECPVVDSFLDSVACGDGAIRANLEEMGGHCLYRGRSLHLLWVLVGSGGNGKSTYINLLKWVFGTANFTAMQPEAINSQFQGASIAGKLAILADDASSQTISEGLSGALKRISGGNTIHTDVKGLDGIDFTPYATVVLSYNRFPSIKSNDGGFMRRFAPVPFNGRFEAGSEGFEPHMDDKLATEEAAERFIVLAVQGLRRLLEHAAPTFSAAGAAVKAAVREANDSVLAWVSTEGIGPSYFIGKTPTEVHKLYSAWCDDAKMKAKTLTDFGRQVPKLLGVKATPTRSRDGSMKRLYALER